MSKEAQGCQLANHHISPQEEQEALSNILPKDELTISSCSTFQFVGNRFQYIHMF
jgi:hypothetical protein